MGFEFAIDSSIEYGIVLRDLRYSVGDERDYTKVSAKCLEIDSGDGVWIGGLEGWRVGVLGIGGLECWMDV